LIAGGPDFSTRPRRRVRPLAWLPVAAGALALGLAVFSTVRAGRRYGEIASRLEQVRGETHDLSERVRAFQAGRGTDLVVARKAMLTAEAPPPRLVSELALLMPGETRLNGISLRYASGVEVEIQVAARNAAAYDAFLDRLEHSPLFTDVMPGEENREGEVRAIIRASYRGAGS
jgi:Tfp pilus assembly protein PilN